MAAYLIANVTVTDMDRYQQYRAGVGPVVERFGGRFLVRAGTIHPVEDDLGFDRCVVLEFPSLDALRTFYDSPDYAPLLALRLESTRSRVMFVEGVAPA
ncbi:DUF1330 domain-containing protein [Roseomonas sp. CCTCC AB2023176]|uniref:DUF1330 domain-containing protein n=1 Tax=Roseomonas sp. CCTCC AB2023176 TaxID=3342640 RepID=UPI0035D8DC1E